MNKFQDSTEYQQKKAFFNQTLTVYGRKPVLEALEDPTLNCFRLHLAESNKVAPIIQQLKTLAVAKRVEIVYHDRQALSRISKNGKQDQGVCLDILCPKHQRYQDFLENNIDKGPIRLLALDRITNPQNLGMIIRSACAGKIDGIVIADKGNARLDSLVIKASAGTLFRAPILKCAQLSTALSDCQDSGAIVIGLSSHSKKTLAELDETAFTIYVLGNETDGVSDSVQALCDSTVCIPMNNQVESLNVAVTASLIAFRSIVN